MTVPVFMCCSVVYGMRLRPAVALGNGAVGRSACHCVCCIARYIIIPSILSGEPTTPNVISEARVSDLRTRPAPASLCAMSSDQIDTDFNSKYTPVTPDGMLGSTMFRGGAFRGGR